jgi:outer membrane protein assembly factor BamD
MMRYARLLTALLLLALGASGCAMLQDKEDRTRDWPADKLYAEAKSALTSGDYPGAIQYYELLEARYPFGRYAQQAQIEIAYAYYKYEEPDLAIAAADRFIKMHPRHEHVDYAYYLKGLANFHRDMGLVERYLPQDASQRDPGAARQSFHDFAELVKRFPDSRYAQDALQRMIYLRNNLAQHELNVADYYMRRGAYVAAANRAKYVVEQYQRTPAVPDALALLAAAYESLGIPELAADARRVLEMNHPEHPALRN